MKVYDALSISTGWDLTIGVVYLSSELYNIHAMLGRYMVAILRAIYARLSLTAQIAHRHRLYSRLSASKSDEILAGSSKMGMWYYYEYY